MKSGARRKTEYGLIVLLCVLAAGSLVSVPAFAEGPGKLPELAAGPGQKPALDEETARRLEDDTVEWDEISNLVFYFNPTYRTYADAADGTNTDLSSAGESFREEMDENLETIDKNLDNVKTQRKQLAGLPGSMVIDAYGTTVDQALAQLDGAENTLKENRRAVRNAAGQAAYSVAHARYTAKENLKPVQEQITRAVEGLLISYEELSVNKSLVEKQIRLYETMLKTQQSLQEKEMATEADVLSTQASLLEARTSLSAIENGMLQIRRAIGLQLGWDADHAPNLGSIPSPDPEYLRTVDREADYQTALENNSSYQKTKDISNYKGTAALRRRDSALNEANAAALSKFESLYARMQEQKLLYEAAETSLKRAGLKKKQAKRMYELGLLGNAEYEGSQLEYLSCEASASLAELAYFSAVNDYQWAVRGYMDY